jgi:hypothetical protein
LAHHYLRLIVDDHSYSGPGLSGWFAHSRRLGISWLIVAEHDCNYWSHLYGPDLLYPYLLLYYTLHPSTKVFYLQASACERLSRPLFHSKMSGIKNRISNCLFFLRNNIYTNIMNAGIPFVLAG